MTDIARDRFLWLLKRTDRIWYDEHDSCVVVAEDEESARLLHPCSTLEHPLRWDSKVRHWFYATGRGLQFSDDSWFPDQLAVQRIGIADPSLPFGTVVCASFNAG